MRTIYLTPLLFFSISAISQTADFTYVYSNNLCSSLTINFTQTCTGSPQGFIWDFGNNNQSTSANPGFTFSQPGTYTVSLTAVYGQTESVVTKTIVIDSADAIKISEDKNYICTPGIINFTAKGNAGAVSYDWNLGDGSSDIITAGNMLPYNFTAFGNYLVTVKVTEKSGCIDTASIAAAVMNPSVTVSISPQSGCIPATVEAVANVAVPAGDNVNNYQWDFGDGTVINTNIDSASHTYKSVGSYLPVLKITTNGGCTSIDSIAAVGFGVPPKNISAAPEHDSVCGSDSVVVLYNAPAATGYFLVWGDGLRDYVPSANINSYFHKYATLGVKTIKVIPLNRGCPGKPFLINVFIKGVIASYNFSDNCTTNDLFHFTNTSQGIPTSILWQFGDGDSAFNNYDPSHRYKNFDSFAATMIVTDSVSHCADTATKILYVNDLALTNKDSSVCKGVVTVFDLSGKFANPAAAYLWNIAGKEYGPDDSLFHSIVADSAGVFNNYVVIDNGPGYCADTVREINTLTVNGPEISFNLADSICQNNSIQAVNLSPLFWGNDSVKDWNWNFDAGGNNDTAYQPQAYYYANAGTYNISLAATDHYGCSDTLIKKFTVNPLPFLQIIPANDTVCLGQSKMLIAFHSGNILWSTGNGISCNTCDTTLVSPATSENIIATATTQFGCVTKDTLSIKVFTPFIATSLFTNSSVCVNDSIQLNASPTDKKITWSPSSNLSATNIYNPLAYPVQPTTYTAVLSDSAGCFSDTLQVNISIKSLPVVDAGPSAVYPYHTSFSFQPTYSADVAAYQWSPAVLLNCSNCPIPEGIADATQTYTVTVKSDSGCIAKDTVTIFVACAGSDLLMPTAFTPNNDGKNDFYYPSARGIKIIKRFAIYDRVGDLVFEKDNFAPNEKSYGWNGKFNSLDQPVGTYVFVVEALCDMGQDVNQQGTFVLIR